MNQITCRGTTAGGAMVGYGLTSASKGAIISEIHGSIVNYYFTYLLPRLAGMKYFRYANFIFWIGKDMQFYFFVGKGKTRVGGSVNHGIKNSSP